MIKIIDYGLGNISAFLNVYRRLNIDASVARNAEDLRGAEKLILPGVGAFDQAMAMLNQSGMRQPLDELVMEKKIPVLGICVGMQILATSSDEGQAEGLGWIDGQVQGFKALGHADLILPHMGWNDVAPSPKARLFAGTVTDWRFYFLHSYYFHCNRPADAVAMSRYGVDFCCAVHSKNIYGVQFHPEKSHHFGMQLLQNFADL